MTTSSTPRPKSTVIAFGYMVWLSDVSQWVGGPDGPYFWTQEEYPEACRFAHLFKGHVYLLTRMPAPVIELDLHVDTDPTPKNPIQLRTGEPSDVLDVTSEYSDVPTRTTPEPIRGI